MEQQARPMRLAELFELDENERRSGLVHRASSSGAAKQTASHAGLATVFIQVSATGSGRWTDELGSVDCAVQLGVQQQPEVKQEPVPGSRSRGHRWIKQLCIAALVLGLMAAAVLVPVSQIMGFGQQLPAQYKLLQPPAVPHRIMFAFSGNKAIPAAGGILPAELAAAVVQWTVVASSGLHVAGFSSRPAMQQAIALLANATGLRYAIADFQLLQDRAVSSVSDPGQLFDLSRLPTRQLQQQQPALQQDPGGGSAGAAAAAFLHSSSSSYGAAQASRLLATHRQRLAERKARRRQLLLEQPALTSIGLPDTAHRLPEQQRDHWVVGAPQQQQQRQAVGTGRATQLLPSSLRSGSTARDLNMQQQQAGSGPSGSTICAVSSLQKSQQLDQHNNSSTSSWASKACEPAATAAANPSASSGSTTNGAGLGQHVEQQQQRRLQQLPLPPPAPMPQPQQAQAKQHVQKGGKGVAWHLTGAGLNARQAWNTTYGFDEVLVAVIDSGVELSHSGVGPAVWVNAGEVAGDALDNDGNGYVDDVMGWDFGGSCAGASCSRCTPGPDPSDMSGWGTHTAAVIAAQPEVAAGTAGIAPGVRVMALKVADCRAGTMLGDWKAQQLSLAGSGTGAVNGAGSSPQQLPATGAAAPVLLASAAMQAIDYALLNGAHIVLAAWRAGGIIGDSSSSSSSADAAGSATYTTASAGQQQLDCVLGDADERGATSSSGRPCLAAVQRLLFLDVLRPLEQAGVLVVTMYPDEEDSSSSSTSTSTSTSTRNRSASPAVGDTAAPLPCSLGLELSNVLCVASSHPVAASSEPLAADVSPAVLFEPLIYDLSSDTSPRPASSSSGGDSSSNNTTDSSSDATDSGSNGTAAAIPGKFSNEPDLATAPEQETNTITSAGGVAVGVTRSLLLARSPVALRAPGKNVLAGWAWGSHAAVSGGSVAAAVAAGAAALTWSNLGQVLGAEAVGAAAHEGLGQLVKQMLVNGGSSGEGSSGSSESGWASPTKKIASGGSSGSGPGSGEPELNLLQSMRLSSAYTGPLQLKPAQLSPALTAVSNSLSYSWHISSPESGPFDTQAMAFVARKALNPAASFPLSDWEFFGYTSLVEVEGFVVVQSPGNYSLAVASEDKFIVWLQDKWLSMAVIGQAGPGLGLDAGAWVAGALFTEPGLYRLRIIIYMPSLSAFDLKWLPPGGSSYIHIPQFASIARTQPLPLQLADQITGHMLMHGDSGSKGVPASSSSFNSKISSEHSSGTIASHQVADSAGDANKGSATAATPNPTSSSPAGISSVSDSGVAAGSLHRIAAMPISTGSAPPASSSIAPDAASSEGAVTAASGSSQLPQDSTNHHTSGYLASPTYMAVDQPAYYPAAATAPASEPPQQQQSYTSSSYSSSSAGSSFGGNGLGSSLSSIFNAIFGGLGLSFERGNGQVRIAPGAAAAAAAGSTAACAAEFSSIPTDFAGSQTTAQQQQLVRHHHHQQQQQQQQQQQPFSTRKQQRSLLGTHWMTPPLSRQAIAPLPGVFSIAATLGEPWEYRTIIPSLKYLGWQHSGILPGPGLEVSSGFVLQRQLLGYVDAADSRSGYGVVQGWLDWQALNPAALEWLQGLGSSGAASAASGAAASTGSSDGDSHGSGWGSGVGGLALGSAGVQFELACGNKERQHGCSLYVDGMVVAGSLGEATISSCVVPARRLINGGSNDGSAGAASSGASSGVAAVSQPEQLLHLELLFAADDLREASFSVRSRPCMLAANGSSELPDGSDGSFAALVPAAGASSLGLSLAGVPTAGGAGSGSTAGGYMRGMLCTVRAVLPAEAAPSGGSNTSSSDGGYSSSSSRHLDKVVFLTAQQMQQAAASTSDAASAEAAAAAAATHGTAAAAVSSGTAHDSHLQATAQVVAGIPGISVQQLAPEWVASLPHDTSYDLTCGCYWNGSWQGGVSVGVGGGSSGSAGLYLAGWPVDVQRVLPQYGPSDIEVKDYSSWQQRQQLASGSAVADPIHWRRHSGLSGGLGGGSGLGALGGLGDPAVAAQVGYRPGMLTGGSVFSLGKLNGLYAHAVPQGSGWAQLLVLQAEGLAGWGRLVVVADVPGADELGGSNSTRPFAPLKQGWLPGDWDTWLPG